MARKVHKTYSSNLFFSPQSPIVEKIRTIAQQVYGADDIELSSEAQAKIGEYTRQVRERNVVHRHHLTSS